MSDLLSQDEFERHAAGFDRLVVLYYADWCPFSWSVLPLFELAEAESSIPMARADLHDPQDERWDARDIVVVPTLVYYEHGEELERLESRCGELLEADEVDGFLERVERLQEQWRYRNGRIQLDRFG